MEYVIPEDLLRALVQYLSQRPYQEVAAAVQALQQLPPVTPASTER